MRYTGLLIVEAPGAGVKVKEVENASPAQKCGIEKNDLLMEVNGNEIQTKQELFQTIEEANVGDSILFGVVRPTDLNNLKQTFKFVVEEDYQKEEVRWQSEKQQKVQN